jgi:hypothetical protein
MVNQEERHKKWTVEKFDKLSREKVIVKLNQIK